MDITKLSEQLHPLERKVLPVLKNNLDLKSIVNASGLKEVEVMRALQWLENKGVVEVKKDVKEIVELDKNGEEALDKGLPEDRLLLIVEEENLRLDEIREKGFSNAELNIALGLCRKKSLVTLDGGKVSITDLGRKALEKESLELKFLKELPLDVAKLRDEQKFAYEALKKRKDLVKTNIVKSREVNLKEIGIKLLSTKFDDKYIDSLNKDLIKNLGWKGKKFRRYDVKINVPKISGGKRHFVRQSIDYARRIWTDLGFKEMDGLLLDTSFWNFDALFTAQDHPVRELQDTFYIKSVAKGKLPSKKIVDMVKKAHESGVGGSKGWQYKWDPEEAMKNVMRPHTTCLSSKTISKLKKEDLPAKFFAVGRCFRNETVDWCHLFEFNQTEGIVIDPNANFRHLLGYLKEFYLKMGYEKVRFRPAHFPYTEPSVEIDVFHPVKKVWVELGGAGMFRPEVVIPLLGKDIPVLAWGQGFDRIATEYFGVNDLRDLYSNDLKQLKEMKFWIK